MQNYGEGFVRKRRKAIGTLTGKLMDRAMILLSCERIHKSTLSFLFQYAKSTINDTEV